MRGGWRGSMGTAGGLTRTYGLQRHFARSEGPDQDAPQSRMGIGELKRISRYFKPYLKQWVIIFGCIIFSSGLSVLPPFCVSLILDKAIPEKDLGLLGLLSGAMVGLALVSGLVGVLQQSLTAYAGQGVMFDIRNELYRHLQLMSLRFFTATRSGEIVSRINNDVNAVQGATTGTLVAIVSNSATLVATSIALLYMNWKLALMAVLIVPAFYLPSKIVGGIRRRLAFQTAERRASLLGFMQERLHVGGSILTQIFGQRRPDAAEFSAQSGALRDLNIKQAVVGRWLFMILSVFSAIGPALIYWYGGYQVIQQNLTPGLLVAFAALLTLLYRPLIQLASVYVDIQAALAVFERIFEYLDMKPDVEDQPEAKRLEATRGHLKFENVGFAYPRPVSVFSKRADKADKNGKDSPKTVFALKNVSFEIAPGEQVALVGPSAAGKTTVTYLAPRFYDPNPGQGRITLDGQDLKGLTQESVRNHIGMVTQETFLFHSSIRDNLLYAKPGAGEDEIVAACRAANIHDFIAGLPEGYDTVVGERGFRLSGGEKQRVSIARALLKDPVILILDEATSSLDATSEHLIQEALEILLKGRTSLIIAHRLSTILSSDKIVVMDGGRVLEMGSHDELVEQGGLYAELFQKQFGKVIDRAQKDPALTAGLKNGH